MIKNKNIIKNQQNYKKKKVNQYSKQSKFKRIIKNKLKNQKIRIK